LDKEIPLAVGQAVADDLKQCQAAYYPEEGHISLIVNHAAEIMAALTT
jgi:hypothetical protein